MKHQQHMINSQIQIPVEDLRLGMYVSKLDRPWLETRFLTQGFPIRSDAEINELRSMCKYVYIDVTRGISTNRQAHQSKSIKNNGLEFRQDILKRKPKPQRYEDKHTVEEELGKAKEVRETLSSTFENVLDDILAGKTVKIDAARDAVQGMVNSIIRNPDAMLWLTRLKTRDDYTYRHSIDASTLAVSFGRHLGLPKKALEDIAFGTLMMDIGKLKLPDFILEKTGPLSEREFTLIKRHVPVGVELAQNIKGITLTSLEIIGFHHERHNGKGYPNSLAGYNIPMYARIGALVDCYDAITSDRPHASAISQAEALKNLYEWRDIDFQADLVEQFIQCLGVFPTGSLIELSNGAIGIILSQNRSLRLRPKILLILDEDKKPYEFSPILDLASEESDKEILIRRSVEADEYGIDPREYYIS